MGQDAHLVAEKDKSGSYPDRATIQHNQAVAGFFCGMTGGTVKTEEIQRMFTNVEQCWRMHLGPQHPSVLKVKSNISLFEEKKKQFQQTVHDVRTMQRFASSIPQ